MTRRGWRRFGVALMSAFMLATSFSHAVAPPAQALVSNVIAADAGGDPIDSIYGGDELWAYVTSATGGFVCIKPALEYGEPYGGCGGGGAYSTIPVPPLFAGYLPVAAGNLKPGEWMLVGTEHDFEPSARSQPFHVNVCTDCVPDGPLRKSDAFKFAANSAITALTAICNGLEAWSIAKRLKEIYQVGMVAYGIGGLTVGTMVAVASNTAGIVAWELVAPQPGPMGAAMWAFCSGFTGVGGYPYSTPSMNGMLHRWVNDPPDPNFTSLYEPTFIDPALYPIDQAAFGVPADRQWVLENAALITYERYQGAIEANDMLWASRQASHLSDLTQQMANESEGVADEMDALAAQVVAADPDPADRSVTAAEYSLAVDARASLAASGFTAAERQQARDLGLTDGWIDWVEGELSRPIAGSPVGQPIDGLLTDGATALRDLAVEWEAFSREAAIVAARDAGGNVAPIASFTATPTNGNAPLTVTFTSTATDADNDSLTLTWDFGDGQVGSGSPVTHEYVNVGTYSPALTVSDGLAEDTSSTSISVTPPGTNQGPIASFTAEPVSGIEPLSVTFTDTSTDPDGDPLTASWDFGDGTTGSGSPSTHEYTQNGTYYPILTVSDGDLTGTSLAIISVYQNQPPVASFTPDKTQVKVPGTVTFTNTSTDPDGQTLTYAWDFGDGESSTETSPDHTFVQEGFYVVRLTATDTSGASVETSLLITAEQNKPPTPVDDDVTADRAVALDILGNDNDPENDPLTLVSYDQPAHGSVDCGDLGGCLYQADSGFIGSDSFDYTVADPDGLETTATVSITVEARPTSNDLNLRSDAIATVAGEAVVVDVLANDSPATLAISDVSDASHGSVTCDPDGPCSYVPDAGFVGYDGFRYTATDGSIQAASDVLVLVAPAAAGLDPTVKGVPGTVTQGDGIDWFVGVKPAPPGLEQSAALLFAAPVEVDLGGAQTVPAGAITTATGWSATSDATGIHLVPSANALLGESLSAALPRPAQPISQGTGGDGHVPIIVGTRVYAFFHHSWPTSVTCIDRSTGQLCPGYPHQLNVGAGNIVGRAAVVDSRIYVHADVSYSGIALYCWDTDLDQTCGLTVVGRTDGATYAVASAPVLVGGLMYFVAQTGLLYCVDPATNEPCAAAPIDTELVRAGINTLDIVAHGNRVFSYDVDVGPASCIDVETRAECPGWLTPRDIGSGYNLVNRHAGNGQTTGVCFVSGLDSKCINDATPGTIDSIGPWSQSNAYWNITSEAEAGTRTFYGSGLGQGGLGCWDWATGAPCVGPNFITEEEAAYAVGFSSRDIDGNFLPSAYGAAWDGTCAVGLGDSGLMFTMGFDGSSPCTSLSTTSAQRSAVDLRSQRCDGTVGAASWLDVRALEVDLTGADAEFTTFQVTVRDAISGTTLATKEMFGTNGVLDLSIINATDHPKLSVDVAATSVPGAPAWSDNNPPRIDLHWSSDPAALCVAATTAVDCAAPNPADATAVALLGTDQAQATVKVARPATCVGNQPPVGVADSYSGPQDANLVEAAPGILENDTDADGDALTATKVGDPAHGTVVLNANGSFTYAPSAGYVGRDSFTYTASDGVASSSTTTVSLTIEKVNHAPTLAAVTDQTIPEMVLFNSLTLDGADSDADTLTYSVESGPTGLTVNGTTGVLSWTPTEAQGPDDYTVAVRVTDPDGLHADRSFTIHVTEVNRDPSLAAIADQTVNPGDAVGLTAAGSDPDLPANTLAYSLIAGPTGATVDPTTGAFAWTASATLGDYPVTIGVSDGVGGSAQRSFTIHVVRDATNLTLGGDSSGQYSDRATITATLKVGSTPVSGASVSIGLGAASQTVTTNGSGVASATFTVPGPAGSVGISASFAGTSSKAPSEASGTFTVNREDSTIVYSGDTIGLASATLNLSATFTDSAAAGFTGSNPETGSGATIGDITKARISFAVYAAANCLGGSPITTMSAFVTDTGTTGDGIGTASVNWSSASEGSFCIVASLVGASGTGTNGYYTAPPAEPAGLAVFIDTAGKVTGGGWVAMADGRGNFGFNASSTGTKVKGNLVFIERTTYQGKKAMLIVKSNAIDALRTSGATFPITATLTGKASYKFISAVDGSTLAESGNATFTATVVDTNAKGGAGDSFAIRVLDKTGAVLVDLGTTTLGGGNIVAHIK